MSLEDLNALSGEQATVQFLRCCSSIGWARRMSERRPFSSVAGMTEAANQIWVSLDREDWLEAFAGHPRIGATEKPSTPSQHWASNEQSGMNAASQDVRERLADANRDYEARFGYIFIVCATGKSADEMLAILGSRLSNAPSDELRIAAAEQAKIMQLRLSKLLNDQGRASMKK